MGEVPKIKNLQGKIGTLERRVEYLDDMITEGAQSEGAKGFMRAEKSALEAALTAMKFHRSEQEGIGDVVGALRQMCSAYENKAGLEEAFFDAMDVLREWET